MALHHLPFPAITTFIFFILLILKLVKNSICRKRSADLPPQPWTLPLIGNLHQHASSAPHRVMRDLAKKYGPLMHLQFGEVSAMVMSSAEVAKEVMKTHDLIFASKPHILVTKIVTYDSKNIVSLVSYGDYWRQLRKISTLELLSAKRVLSFKPIRNEEMEKLIKSVSSRTGTSIDLSEKTHMMSLDIISKAVFGKSMGNDTRLFLSLVSTTAKLASGFCVEDIFPSYRYLHVFSRVKPKLEAYQQDIDKIVERIIHDDEVTEGLLHTLKILQEDPESHLTLDHIKAVLLDVLPGGSETSGTLVLWAMAELMKNPKVLEKAQAEVRQILDEQGFADESKLQELNYLNLVIKEVFRLHPDLIVKHASLMAMKFRRKQGLLLTVGLSGGILNIGRIQRNSSQRGLLTITVEYFLANMLFHFDWKLPKGMQPNTINMTESFEPVKFGTVYLCI